VDIKLKKRIIGFLLLIGFGLILVPLFFGHAIPEDELKLSSHVPAAPAAPKNIAVPMPDSSVTMPDVASVSVPTTQAVAPHSPSAVVFEQVQSTADVNAPSIPAPSAAPAVVPSTAPVSSKAGAASPNNSNNLSSTASAPTPVISTAKAPVEAPKPPVPALKLSKSISSVTSKKASTQTKKELPLTKAWVVQLGSFSDKANADRLVKKLQAQGFKAYKKTTQTTKGPLIRVLIGPELTRSQAQSTAKKLKDQLGLTSVVTFLES